MKRAILYALGLVALIGTAACASATVSSQTPGMYLEGALNWMQAHSATSKQVDWNGIRRDALALAPSAKTTAETYPAIRLAISRLGDGNAFLRPPDQASYEPSFHADHRNGIIRWLRPGGPAEKAGLRLGDVIETLNGAPPRALDGNPASIFMDPGQQAAQLDLTVRREGEAKPISTSFMQEPAVFAFEGKPNLRRMGSGALEAGYIELAMDSGGTPGPYTGAVHQFMREVDESPMCGWIIDLRRNSGGNLWTYFAAVGPLLGEGELGGFVYPDGKRELWTYEGGKIKWNGDVRDESEVTGGVYTSKRSSPPIVLLISRYTIAAGELVAVAFQGRPNVRVLGEPTGGVATLSLHTPLSDGAHLFVSGAYGTDKRGTVYDKPIQPDEFFAADWRKIGTVEDAALAEAYAWLMSQPDCS